MKNETTKKLEQLIHGVTARNGTFGCFEVTIGWNGKERVDYLTYDNNGVFKCYEIKSSVADFRSKSAHTFVGHYNYYVLTKEVYNAVKNEIPSDVGVYIGDSIVKGARRRQLVVDETVLRDSLIRSLHREAEKLYQMNSDTYAMAVKTELAEANRCIVRLKAQYNDMLTFIYRNIGYDWQFDYDDYYMNTTKRERNNHKAEEIARARELMRREKKKTVVGESLECREKRIYKYITRYE